MCGESRKLELKQRSTQEIFGVAQRIVEDAVAVNASYIVSEELPETWAKIA